MKLDVFTDLCVNNFSVYQELLKLVHFYWVI